MPCRPIVLLLVGSVIPAIAQQTCDHLTMFALPGIVITQATPVAAGDSSQVSTGTTAPAKDLPAFCRVQGVIRPEVRFELWLPERWNHKLLMVGNGGLAGTISRNAMLEPLRLGYATSSTDTGHVADNDGHWAAGHMERVIDFAHRAVHVTTQAESHRACLLRRGARTCLLPGMFARRPGSPYGGAALSRRFDGIIAGDPANYWTHLYMGAHLWITLATRPMLPAISRRRRRRSSATPSPRHATRSTASKTASLTILAAAISILHAPVQERRRAKLPHCAAVGSCEEDLSRCAYAPKATRFFPGSCPAASPVRRAGRITLPVPNWTRQAFRAGVALSPLRRL